MSLASVSGVEVVSPSALTVDTIWVQPDDGLNFVRSLPVIHTYVPNNHMPLTPFHGRMTWSDCVIRSNTPLELGSHISFMYDDMRYVDAMPIALDDRTGEYTCVVSMVQRLDDGQLS